MLTDHRHQEILSRVNLTGRASIAELATALKVSEETIRRDMKALEERGLLRRIHGGAVRLRLDKEQPLAERCKVNQREKTQIAVIAERLIRENMSIFVDTGTSTLALVRRLIGPSLTVTTNSLDAASLLRHGPSTVRLTPGTLRPQDNALVGYETVGYAKRFFFDIAFVGIGACDLEHGWMDYEEHESVLRKALLRQARDVVVLVDSSKFGRKANICTYQFSDRLTVVSERPPPKMFQDIFKKNEIRILTE